MRSQAGARERGDGCLWMRAVLYPGGICGMVAGRKSSLRRDNATIPRDAGACMFGIEALIPQDCGVGADKSVAPASLNLAGAHPVTSSRVRWNRLLFKQASSWGVGTVAGALVRQFEQLQEPGPCALEFASQAGTNFNNRYYEPSKQPCPCRDRCRQE